MNGIIAYGAYVPYYRLKRSEIAAALGEVGGNGIRAVASYDEDTTSMGVEAARMALAGVPAAAWPRRLTFSTTDPAYLDKTNAAVLHAALSLESTTLATDAIGSVRSGIGAIISSAEASVNALAVVSDIRTGLSGGVDERDGGDAAAALLFGRGTAAAPVIADLVAYASSTSEFLDRWRVPGANASGVWEERFGETIYAAAANAAFTDALKQAGVTADDVDHLVVAGLHGRANRAFAKASGVAARPSTVADLGTVVGNTGSAHAGLTLANVLDRADPGQTIALVVLADGAAAFVWRTTPALAAGRPSVSVAAQVALGDDTLRYSRYLAWRGQLAKEPQRRPDPVGPAAPASMRSQAYKYGFMGSQCDRCGHRHLPPVRVCTMCQALDQMTPVPMADCEARVTTYAIDHLAHSKNPPIVFAVVDFDGGGRLACELTDVDADRVAIGDRVGMSFRRLVTAGGVHNYFWKAKPLRGSAGRRVV